MLTTKVAKGALLLVNDENAYGGLQDIIDYLIENERNSLEIMDAGPALYRAQGKIALLKKLKKLREEVLARVEEDR